MPQSGLSTTAKSASASLGHRHHQQIAPNPLAIRIRNHETHLGSHGGEARTQEAAQAVRV
ncbi:hypothetical protein [Streptomyces tricolor]|uniref:hypothetical protein n=1 Tax=Streptomyces tricolor TaxID=68277 RepID=UPI003D73586F